MWREPWQPHVLLLHLWNIPFGAGQPYHYLIAETERPVVPPAWLDWQNGKMGPLGKLTCDQATDQRNVDVVTVYASCSGGQESLPSLNDAQRRLPSVVPRPNPDCIVRVLP
jgi:hypothetical protein